MEPNVSVTNQFSVDDGWEPGTCRVQFTITVKNEGKVSFDVKQLHFRAWHLDFPKTTPAQATFLDADRDFERGQQIIDQSISNTLLTRHYSPGQQLTQSFNWIVRRQTPGITNFTVAVAAQAGEWETVGHGRHWSNTLCADSSLAANRMAVAGQQQ